MLITGTDKSEYLAGMPGNDIMVGLAGDDTLDAGAGDDQIYGGAGGDQLIGGAGDDQLAGDKMMMATANAETIRRLYLATLDRGPDDGGWGAWTAALDSGTSLQDITRGFVASAEFSAKYGALSDSDFIRLLYVNVLDREPAASEVNDWLGGMSGGLTREDVVVGFSESAEFRWMTNGEVQTGQVFRLYDAVFDRQPDGGGFDHWLNAMENGYSLSDVAARFVVSQEFQNTYGDLGDDAFVTQLYRNVLGREPDISEVRDWLNHMDQGYSRTDVLLGFSESAEFQAAKQGELVNYMQTAAPQWADVMEGGEGSDALSGDRGSDTFVFAAGQAGEDHVYDYEAWDFARFDDYQTVEQVLSHFTQYGPDAVFSDQGQVIVFHDTKIADIAII